MRFRPCIDLHAGQVKQIIGSTLADDPDTDPTVNFATTRTAADYAAMYGRDKLAGGHVIMLGPGNETAAAAALAAYPGGLQIGGGITGANATAWLRRGAAHVIVTSFLFTDGCFRPARLEELVRAVGRDRLVLDLSCRARDGAYWVVTDRWQTWSDLELTEANLRDLAGHCAEFLVHGVDVEGRQLGLERPLVEQLGRWSPVPTVYAGGICTPADIRCLSESGGGRLDYTVGSALDIFGGRGLRYRDLVGGVHG